MWNPGVRSADCEILAMLGCFLCGVLAPEALKVSGCEARKTGIVINDLLEEPLGRLHFPGDTVLYLASLSKVKVSQLKSPQ